MNQSQYDEVKNIIELLNNHDKGVHSEIFEYILPTKENNDNVNKLIKDDAVVTNQNTNKDLLEFLGFDVNDMQHESLNKNELFDPFDNRSDLSKVFNAETSKQKKQSKTRKQSKSKKQRNVDIALFDPFNKNYKSKTKKTNSNLRASRLRSPSMKSMRNKMGVPDGK